jgi:hypothetical protein
MGFTAERRVYGGRIQYTYVVVLRSLASVQYTYGLVGAQAVSSVRAQKRVRKQRVQDLRVCFSLAVTKKENGGEHVRMHGHHGRTTPTVLGSALPLQCRTLEVSRDGLSIYAMVCERTIRGDCVGRCE